MYECADLTDGVEESGTRLVVCDVNESDVRIVLECLLYNSEVRSLVYRVDDILSDLSTMTKWSTPKSD